MDERVKQKVIYEHCVMKSLGVSTEKQAHILRSFSPQWWDIIRPLQ